MPTDFNYCGCGTPAVYGTKWCLGHSTPGCRPGQPCHPACGLYFQSPTSGSSGKWRCWVKLTEGPREAPEDKVRRLQTELEQAEKELVAAQEAEKLAYLDAFITKCPRAGGGPHVWIPGPYSLDVPMHSGCEIRLRQAEYHCRCGVTAKLTG